MGLLDSVRDWLGLGAESAASRAADPDDLFGMSTAYVTMDADLNYESTGTAAVAFAGMDSTDFAEAVDEARDIVQAGDEGTVARVGEDDYGYQWVVLEDPDFEDLIVGIHATAETFIARGYSPRLLAAVFEFERARQRSGDDADRVYWVYSFRRGSYYPFAPVGERERDFATEFKLRSVLDGELDVEADEAYWYPLWPDRPGGRPWP